MKPLNPNDAPDGDIACLPEGFRLDHKMGDVCNGCKYEGCMAACPKDDAGGLHCVNRADDWYVIYKDRG